MITSEMWTFLGIFHGMKLLLKIMPVTHIFKGCEKAHNKRQLYNKADKIKTENRDHERGMSQGIILTEPNVFSENEHLIQL